MDVGGWNGATEYDWWLHYNLAPDGPQQPLPLVVQSCPEAHEELGKLYRPLQLDPEIVCRLLGPGWEEDNSACATRCDRPDFPRFNPDLDTLRWAGTARWGSSVSTPPNPLFLAACLSVRRVVVEYAPAIANQLEVLALAVLDDRRPLRSLDILTTSPSEGGMLRFRLAETPRELPYLQAGETVSQTVSKHGVAFFPWFRPGGPEGHLPEGHLPENLDPVALQAVETQYPEAKFLLDDARIRGPASYCILQVVNYTSPSLGVAARRKALASPEKLSFHYKHARGAIQFGESMQTDIMLWLNGLKMYAAGFPANLPFEISGMCCHGFCTGQWGS